MGMTAVCSGDCGYRARSDSHRGSRLGNCPQCGAPMRGWTAGQAKGRYVCPIGGWVITHGLRRTVELDQPMRLEFIPGWDTSGPYEPDPDRPGWMRPVKRHRAEPDDREREYLDRAAGRVFGPGCVISSGFLPRSPDSRLAGEAGVCLLPAPDADPAAWFVNEPLKYKKCAACSSWVAVTEQTMMPGPWTPRRRYYSTGRNGRSRTTADTSPGPHPAGTVACRDCDPRRKD